MEFILIQLDEGSLATINCIENETNEILYTVYWAYVEGCSWVGPFSNRETALSMMAYVNGCINLKEFLAKKFSKELEAASTELQNNLDTGNLDGWELLYMAESYDQVFQNIRDFQNTLINSLHHFLMKTKVKDEKQELKP